MKQVFLQSLPELVLEYSSTPMIYYLPDVLKQRNKS